MEQKKRLLFRFFAIACFLSAMAVSYAQTLPYTFVNNSEYSDDEIYVAIVGITDGHVWVDAATGDVNAMSTSDNTIAGPVYNGEQGPGGNGLYANCFRKLSEIPDKTVNIPQIAGCRIMMSFGSQLYLYFYGSTSGYAAPNLANGNDPNQGIRYELVELTYNDYGLWCNTTRVDAYQYPMGLEVWGTDFYKKVGEILPHSDIISRWKANAPTAFQACLDESDEIIQFPSKTPEFQENGTYESYFDTYIDEIWDTYTNAQLVFNSGDAGIWRGSVQNDVFTLTRDSDGQVAYIYSKPTTLEAMEGSGSLATGGQWDLVVQAQICAAINRHAIDVSMTSGETQNFGNTTGYYQSSPYNGYCKFWHDSNITYQGQTYAFCYDDVFDQSSTVHTDAPENITITIGGFYNADDNSGDSGSDSTWSTTIEAENFSSSSGVQNEDCDEGGQNVGYIDTGDWMAYADIEIPYSGTYTVKYRVASESSGGQLSLDYASGAVVLDYADIPVTGAWQTWTTVSSTVTLDAGTYDFGIYAQSGGWNINWFSITYSGLKSSKAASATLPVPDEISIFPNPATTQINLTGIDSPTLVKIFSLSGTLVKTGYSPSLDISDIDPGTYIIYINNGKVVQHTQFIKK